MIDEKIIDKQIDEYIEEGPKYSDKITKTIVDFVRNSDFEIEETLINGKASFNYKGELFSFQIFKNHVGVYFPKGILFKDENEYLINGTGSNSDMKYLRLNDQNYNELEYISNFILQAIEINDKGLEVPNSENQIEVEPDLFTEALDNNPDAKDYYESLPESHQAEYKEWIFSAKKEDTKLRRLNKALMLLNDKRKLKDKYS